jgi:hypothetical protein
MSFFTLSNGESLEAINKFENSGRQGIIPAGTQLICDIVAAKWAPADSRNEEHIVIDLFVVQAGQYKGYTVKHKLHVNDLDDKKKDKALRMLMAYDTLCKGLLLKADQAGKEITDAILAKALVAGEVCATFDVWETERADGTTMTGNWVRAIGPKSKVEQAKDKKIMEKAKQVAEELDADFEDEIPF